MTTMEWVQARKLIAIVRGLEPACITDLAEALHAGGIDLIEVTFNQADQESWQRTAEAILAIAKKAERRMLPGAGTVLNEAQLTLACEAGARYIITPNTNPNFIEKVKKMGLCCFPGAFTPSEITAAYNSGADAVKLFPAGQLGPEYIKALRAPLSHIPLMAVGGVNEKNAAHFVSAGCMGLGVGGSLVNSEWIKAEKWEKITALAAEYRKVVS